MKGTEAVTNMTRFPFYLQEELNREGFIKKYHLIFDKNIKRCFTKERPIREDDGTYDIFCGELILLFSKVNGEYKFTDLGVND